MCLDSTQITAIFNQINCAQLFGQLPLIVPETIARMTQIFYTLCFRDGPVLQICVSTKVIRDTYYPVYQVGPVLILYFP